MPRTGHRDQHTYFLLSHSLRPSPSYSQMIHKSKDTGKLLECHTVINNHSIPSLHHGKISPRTRSLRFVGFHSLLSGSKSSNGLGKHMASPFQASDIIELSDNIISCSDLLLSC